MVYEWSCQHAKGGAGKSGGVAAFFCGQNERGAKCGFAAALLEAQGIFPQQQILTNEEEVRTEALRTILSNMF
jgi:hypothetical protein